MKAARQAKGRNNGSRWFEALDVQDRWRFSEETVMSLFDWRDWFDAKPSRDFLVGAETARVRWEMES